MIVEKRRDYTVNMGNYESHRFGATVTLSAEDIGVAPGLEGFKILSETADSMLEQALAKELHEVSEVTGTANSYVLTMDLSNA